MKAQLLKLLDRTPALKAFFRRVKRRILPHSSVSSNYVEIGPAERDAEAKRLAGSWKEENLPKRQRVLVDAQLSSYRKGEHIDVFDVFIKAIDTFTDLPPNGTLLEIGCSSGYYSEVLRIAGKSLVYTGCDYSESFIQLGRSIYPDVALDVEDATGLTYRDQSFDLVVSGCCLLHIPEYDKAIAETVRVSRDYVIFHRTPVVFGQETRFYRKQAYGVETVEIHVSEEELLSLFAINNLTLLSSLTLHEEKQTSHPGRGSASRTYICRKNAIS